jgi:beta-lactamase regulating signal transducer with metallopeptidase domain/tetratricopeptide (TPR) repeat protein
MMIPVWSASPIWAAVGWTMLHFLWIGAILGAFAVFGRLVLRTARAEVQYIYGLGCMAILAMTPLLIAVALLSETSTPEIPPKEAATLPSIPSSVAASVDRVRVGALIAPLPDRAPPSAATSRADDDSRLKPGVHVMAALALYLPYLWLVGAPITFTYLAVGFAGAERLRRQSILVVDPGLREVARRLADSLGVARRVVLATCERLSAPVLVGIVRPTILLPAAALTGWSPDQLEMALLHELVHVRRWDTLVILLQRLVESTLFFHPVIWVVSGWVHRDREHCCDGAVVRHTGRPLAYAEVLLALTDVKPSRSPVAVAMAEGDLVARVRRLLYPEDHSMKLPRITIALATGLLLVPALLIGAQAALSRSDGQSPKGGANEVPGTSNAEDTGRDKGRDEANRRVVEEAIKAITESADKASSTTLSDIAQAQAKIGDRAAALETLRQAARLAAEAKQPVERKGNTVTYGLSSAWQLWRVGQIQAELGDEPGALDTLRLALRAEDDQEAEDRRIETLAVIAKELTALGARDESREVAERADRDVEAMGNAANDQAVLPQLAAVHVAAGDIDGAFDLLDRVADSPRNDRIKQAILGRALGLMAQAAETADRASARPLLDRVLRRLDEIQLAEDKLLALIDISRALAEVGEFERARQAARLIGEGPSGVDYDGRDGKAYAMLLISLEQRKAGDVEGARGTLREAYETTKVVDESRGKSGRLLQVAEGMIAMGDLAGALRCIEDMLPGRRHETLAEIAVAQRRAGNRGAAHATFLRAIEDAELQRGHRPRPGVDAPKFLLVDEPDDARWNAQIARNVAKIRAMMGSFEEARKTADSIPDPSWRAFALADVARAQAAAGDAQAALDWSRKLALPRSDPSPLKAIIEGIAEYAQAKGNRTP